MEPDSTDYENEHKFLLSPPQASLFCATTARWLTPRVYDADRPVAFTRTTYLDTEDLHYFRSTDGAVERRLRIREYGGAAHPDGEPAPTGPCYLELKERAGDRRTKLRVPAPIGAIAEVLASRGRSIPPAWRNGSPYRPALRALRDELAARTVAARVSTWYQRISLISAAERVRVTLDLGITFLSPPRLGATWSASWSTLGNVIGHGPLRILEVKHQGTAPAWLAHAMAPLGEPAKISKYALAMAALGA
jgi:hypothetical protein